MIQYEKAEDQEKLLESEKKALETEYANAIKELYPDIPLEDRVILNIKSTFRSPYNGYVTSRIELYKKDGNPSQKIIVPNVLSLVKPIPEKQSYVLTCINRTSEATTPFLYGTPVLLPKEEFLELGTIKLTWKQTTELFASTIVQYITITGQEITKTHAIPVYDVAAEHVCLQDFPYTDSSGYTELADKFMESHTDYYSFYTNSFPNEMRKDKIIQLPMSYEKTMKTIKKMNLGKGITDIQKDLGLRIHEYQKCKPEDRTDAETIQELLSHTILPKEFAKEIRKRYYRLTVLKKEQVLLPDGFPLESMLD